MDRVVTSQRARLAPYIERLNGLDVREEFRGVFDRAAGRFALGKIDATEFRGIVGELVRDASGTAYQQDRAAQRSAADGVRDTSEPWATMPRDGSGQLGRVERVVYSLIGAACAAALLLMGWTLGAFGADSPDAPAAPVSVSVPDVRDAAMITRGAGWSWAAADECGHGPVACDRALRDINGEAAPYGLRVWEDGSVSPR